MAKLIDADAVGERLNKLCGKYCPYADATDGLCTKCLLGIAKAEVAGTPSVSAITAMYYYYEERDREYAERMEEAWQTWKNT